MDSIVPGTGKDGMIIHRKMWGETVARAMEEGSSEERGQEDTVQLSDLRQECSQTAVHLRPVASWTGKVCSPQALGAGRAGEGCLLTAF